MVEMKLRGDPSNQIVELQIKDQGLTTTRGIRQGFYFLGRALAEESKRGILEPPKTGKTYKIKRGESGRMFTHQASAPGEYPANLTGTLRSGIWFEVRDRQLVFGAEATYAPFLELGTGKMKPRPFLEPSVKANERNAIMFLERELKRALENEGR